MPQIEHRDLVAFADEKVNLKKSEVDDQRAQVNRLRDRIEAKIAASPGYGFVKALHAGSVAKGTALRNVNDRDLAVYVKADQAPDDIPGLVNWARDRVVEAYPVLSNDQIVANTHCVTVTFAASGLEVDVVPVLYEGEANDIGYLISKDNGDKLKTSVRLHLDFIRGHKKVHPKHLAQLIRFTKWWARQQRKRDGEFKCKSFMLELLWVHLADEGLALNNYAEALEQFFAFIVDGGLDAQIASPTSIRRLTSLPAEAHQSRYSIQSTSTTTSPNTTRRTTVIGLLLRRKKRSTQSPRPTTSQPRGWRSSCGRTYLVPASRLRHE